MHVLVFEKNSALATFFTNAFNSESITCRMFLNIADYFEERLVDTVTPEVVVFDSEGFPSTDLDLLKQFLIEGVPVLILTPKTGSAGRIEFLEWGAEDCMTKPINGQELILRLQKILKRNLTSRTNSQFSNIRIDENKRDLLVDDRPAKLNHHEYLLAENFYYHPGKVFGRMALLELVWNRHCELESNVVEATISSLRKKMKSQGALAQIKSKRNLGYWLEC